MVFVRGRCGNFSPVRRVHSSVVSSGCKNLQLDERQLLVNRHFGILNSSIEWANVHTLRVQTPNSSSLVLSVTFLQGFVKRKESFEVDSCFL
jgi:hypothetical protein